MIRYEIICVSVQCNVFTIRKSQQEGLHPGEWLFYLITLVSSIYVKVKLSLCLAKYRAIKTHLLN